MPPLLGSGVFGCYHCTVVKESRVTTFVRSFHFSLSVWRRNKSMLGVPEMGLYSQLQGVTDILTLSQWNRGQCWVVCCNLAKHELKSLTKEMDYMFTQGVKLASWS